MLPDILRETSPSFINGAFLKKFEIGTREPELLNVRAWKDAEDIMEDAFIECDLSWCSEQVRAANLRVHECKIGAWMGFRGARNPKTPAYPTGPAANPTPPSPRRTSASR